MKYKYESAYRIRKLKREIKAILKWDVEKINLWFISKNPMLGNSSPEDFIKTGRLDKLEKFVYRALEENVR